MNPCIRLHSEVDSEDVLYIIGGKGFTPDTRGLQNYVEIETNGNNWRALQPDLSSSALLVKGGFVQSTGQSPDVHRPNPM
jgi:hypothetical protein